MKTHAVMLLVLTGCPGGGNPSRLYLAPDQAETRVKLQDTEPRNF